MKKRKVKKDLFKDIKKNKKNHTKCAGPCGGAVYGLGFIGAVIYYIQFATSFWMGVLGFLKALVWPIFLVYELLKFLMA